MLEENRSWAIDWLLAKLELTVTSLYNYKYCQDEIDQINENDTHIHHQLLRYRKSEQPQLRQQIMPAWREWNANMTE